MSAAVAATIPDSFEGHGEAVDEIVLALSMARGLDEVLETVRTRARALIGCDGVTFVLRDGDKCHYADEDAISPLWKGQRFPAETCISGWAMAHRTAVVVDDIYADDRIPHAAYRPTFVRSLAMIPVRMDDPVAAIGAYWARHWHPTPRQLSTLTRIANSAAVALTNIALFAELEAARRQAESAKDAIIFAMAAIAEMRDNETGNHIHRTQHYVRLLAEAAVPLYPDVLDPVTVELIVKSAPLHDIGKVGIPDRILLKAGPLTPEERAIMQEHAEIGRRAIATAQKHLDCGPFLTLAGEIAHTHHERWDGTGYPRGLAGNDIPLAGRIMAIADVYDALVSARVYKPALPHAEAVRLIAAERGRHFDPALTDLFLTLAPHFARIHHHFRDA